MAMRRLASALFAVAVLSGLGRAATPPIDPEALLSHIRFLASDDLKGRGNGSDGLERAADYVATKFREAGLAPGAEGSHWFQPFELAAGLEVGEGNALAFRTPNRTVRLELGESYFPIAATPDSGGVRLSGMPVVFAGYGISAPSFDYDDYAGMDVSGSAVLIFSHEPQENRRDSRLNGSRPLDETTLYSKAAAARTRGARALIVVSDPSHPTDPVNYEAFRFDPDAEDQGIPVLRVRRDDVAPLLEDLGLKGVAAMIDADLMPRSRRLNGVTADYTQHLGARRRTVRNVVGVLAGADRGKRNQALVIGAHLDHVGLGGRFSSAPERTGEIHNGADDNASGIAAMIEIARAASADSSRFQRSLVFVAFSGEERGLLGSVHYTQNPVIPLSDTVLMLNLDMIGRARGRVEVGGLSRSSSLARDVAAAARIAGLDARSGGPGAGRSDDSSFLDRRIPALHFFTGFHDDYHSPTDDWQLIDAPGAARVATLVLEVAARVSARDGRPDFADR
jgi:hypothetical protein